MEKSGYIARNKSTAYIILDYEGNQISEVGPWQHGGVETHSMKKRKNEEDRKTEDKPEKREKRDVSARFLNPTSSTSSTTMMTKDNFEGFTTRFEPVISEELSESKDIPASTSS